MEISMGDIKASEKWPSRSSCFLLFLMFETVGLNFKPLKENGYFFVLFFLFQRQVKLLSLPVKKWSSIDFPKTAACEAADTHRYTTRLVFPPTNPYWWHITTPIWVASDWSCRLGNLFQPIKKHYPVLVNGTSSVRDFSYARSSDVILRETQCCFLWLP